MTPPTRLFASLIFLFACSGSDGSLGREPDLQLGKVRAYVVRAAGAARGVVPGDYVLEGPELGIAVRAGDSAAERGAIIGVKQGKWPHDWESLRPLLDVDGALIPASLAGVRIERAGDRPSLVTRWRASSGASTFLLEQRMRIADVRSALRIDSELRVRGGKRPASLKLVERVAFGGGAPLVPKLGPLRPGPPVTGEWLGSGAGADALVLGALSGELTVHGHSLDHSRADQIRYSEVTLPTRHAGGGLYRAEAVLAASRTGLGNAVRALGWVRRRPFPEIVATLDTLAPGTRVDVVEVDGGIVGSALPDGRRRAIVPLPTSALGVPLEIRVRAGTVEAVAPQRVPAGPPFPPVQLSLPARSKLVVNVRHAASGDALPARIRVLPLKGTAAPSFGPDWAASGAIDTLIAARGSAEVDLSPGYYRVIVTHGPEWTIADRAIELGPSARVVVDADLDQAVDPGAWVACEFHVHQSPSPDSKVSLEDRVASLVAEGVSFAVPTDHNHVTDLSDSAHRQPLRGLFSVPGVEVTTEEPSFGHFNAFPHPLDPALPAGGAPEFRGREPHELFEALHAASPALVVQVNHPRMDDEIGYFDITDYDPSTDRGGSLWSPAFDALEVWNGFDLARWPRVERVFGEWLAMLAHGHRIVATGSSDSHTIRSEGAGYPRTYVLAPVAGVAHGADIVAALRAGRAFVTSGPFLNVRVGEAQLGDTVELRDGRTKVDVFVQVANWMKVTTLRVYLGTELLSSQPLGAPTATVKGGSRYRRTLSLPIERPGPLVVSVEGEATLQPVIARAGVRPFAFTNPVWLVRAGEAPPAGSAGSTNVSNTAHEGE